MQDHSEQANISLDRWITVVFGLALLLDVPAAHAYQEHTAWTERLGRFLFNGIGELTGLPIPFTAFELLSYGLAAWVVLLYGWQRSRLWSCLALCGLLLPAIGILGLLLGMAHGYSLGLALTQLHFIPLVGLWLVLGYFVGMRPRLQGRLVRLVFWLSLWRASYAWYVYAVIYRGSLGDREYLIDHASSMFLLLGLVYAGFQIWAQKHAMKRVFSYSLGFLWILGPYLLNDRRASFAGVMAAGMILPWVLPPLARQAFLPGYRRGLLLAGALFVFFAMHSDDPNGLAGALRTETALASDLTYRHIENFNLMSGVIQHPLLGMGFGTPYPQVLPLPDISFTFPLYQAIPHNNVYFLWAFAGPLGLAALLTISNALLLVVVRCGRLAQRSSELLLTLIAFAAVTQWLLYVFFDMGLLESRSMMLVGMFAGGLFPSYARSLGEHIYGNKDETLAHQPDQLGGAASHAMRHTY